jgi:hypothetical protein
VFHGTSVNVVVPDGIGDAWAWIQGRKMTATPQDAWYGAAMAQYRRVKRELCGVKDCKCGIVRY